jgi:tRNA threonylcarbamoyladenosine biosynthesis protein TsaB
LQDLTPSAGYYRIRVMKILALETSTDYCSCALWCDGEAEQRGQLAQQKHSELLLPMVSDLLHSASLGVRDLDGIAFGAGPGSFTGLRIACGVAQGLAFAAGLPVAGVCTLEAMALAADSSKVITALDARMGQIYVATYIAAGDSVRATEAPQLCDPQDAPALTGSGWTAVGNGFAAYRSVLNARYGAQLGAVNADVFPQAVDVAKLAARILAAGAGVPADQATPFYLRDKVALTSHEQQAKR